MNEHDESMGLSETELYDIIESAMDDAQVAGLDPMDGLKHVIAAAIAANNERLNGQLVAFLEKRRGSREE